ncbi:hypothetical protein J8273_0277 [Carpediemonas membranifera]|uniref:EF-hand domain-containing protein n=1 Tax=Carpediemonas membranifera TaxID=201153 RepID=A0A8J6BZ06_9EUKA|nr:hypothetical protein J8273_0277 [Carpediemonas membranifera]|eukprot:KAG9395061.1 hypothetical protein J8273_0277 [Carpediemonas membranifera]
MARLSERKASPPRLTPAQRKRAQLKAARERSGVRVVTFLNPKTRNSSDDTDVRRSFQMSLDDPKNLIMELEHADRAKNGEMTGKVSRTTFSRLIREKAHMGLDTLSMDKLMEALTGTKQEHFTGDAEQCVDYEKVMKKYALPPATKPHPIGEAIHEKLSQRYHDVHAMFRFFDAQGTAAIHRQDLARYVREIDPHMPQASVDAFFDDVARGQETIDINQFARGLVGQPATVPDAPPPPATPRRRPGAVVSAFRNAEVDADIHQENSDAAKDFAARCYAHTPALPPPDPLPADLQAAAFLLADRIEQRGSVASLLSSIEGLERVSFEKELHRIGVDPLTAGALAENCCTPSGLISPYLVAQVARTAVPLQAKAAEQQRLHHQPATPRTPRHVQPAADLPQLMEDAGLTRRTLAYALSELPDRPAAHTVETAMRAMAGKTKLARELCDAALDPRGLEQTLGLPSVSTPSYGDLDPRHAKLREIRGCGILTPAPRPAPKEANMTQDSRRFAENLFSEGVELPARPKSAPRLRVNNGTMRDIIQATGTPDQPRRMRGATGTHHCNSDHLKFRKNAVVGGRTWETTRANRTPTGNLVLGAVVPSSPMEKPRGKVHITPAKSENDGSARLFSVSAFSTGHNPVRMSLPGTPNTGRWAQSLEGCFD